MEIKNHAANSFQIDHAGVKTTPFEKFLKVFFLFTFALLVISFIGVFIFADFSLPIGKQDSKIIYTNPIGWSSQTIKSSAKGERIYIYSMSGKVKNMSDTSYENLKINIVFILENGKTQTETQTLTILEAGEEKYIHFELKTSSDVVSNKSYVNANGEEFEIKNLKGIHRTLVLFVFLGVLIAFVLQCFIIAGIDKKKRKIRRAMACNNIVVVDNDGIKNDVHLDETDASKIVQCVYCGMFNYKSNYKCKGCGSMLERSVRNEKEDYYGENEE